MLWPSMVVRSNAIEGKLSSIDIAHLTQAPIRACHRRCAALRQQKETRERFLGIARKLNYKIDMNASDPLVQQSGTSSCCCSS